MTHQGSPARRSLYGAAFVLAVAGCASGQAETNVVKKPLPMRPPAVAPFELTQASPHARLTPKEGVRSAVQPELRMSAVQDIPADAPVVKAAEQAAAVKAALGNRYFFIDADPIRRHDPFCSPPKSGTGPSQAQAPHAATRITYFSYSHNKPVIVCMRGHDVASLPRIPADYQPPEGEAEMEEAKRVARMDERIRDKVRHLDAHVILADPEWRLWWWDAEGYGHRVFYVTFAEGRTGNPEYYAVVDLTEENDKEKVRQAGEEPRQQ